MGIKPGAPGRFAVTVHRVQGATLEGDVHVLLNSEFFADGQAVRRHDTCSTVVELSARPDWTVASHHREGGGVPGHPRAVI